MDKKLKDQLKTNASVIGEQQEKIAEQDKKLGNYEKELVGLRKFKLAWKIAEEMVLKEMIDPEDFQEKVNILNTKSAEDLTKRKDLLSVRDVESTLELGIVEENKNEIKIAEKEIRSASPHSQESLEVGSSFIQNMINT